MEKRKRKRIRTTRPIQPTQLKENQPVLETSPKDEATKTNNSEYHPKSQSLAENHEKRPWAKDMTQEEKISPYKAFLRYWLNKAEE